MFRPDGVRHVILIGRWVDLYLMVFPATLGETPVFGIWETAAIICAAVTGLSLVDRSFRSANPVPSLDAHCNESLTYHAN